MIKNFSFVFTIFIFSACSFTDNQEEKQRLIYEAELLFFSGLEDFYSADYNSAVNYFSSSYSSFTLLDNLEGKIKSALQLYKIYAIQKDDSSSKYWWTIAESHSKTEKMFHYLMQAANAEILYQNGEYDELISSFSEAAKSDFPNEYKTAMLSQIIISKIKTGKTITDEIELLEECIDELKDFIEVKPLSAGIPLGFAYYTLGYFNLENERIELAEKYFLKSYKVDQKNSNSSGIADNLYQLGSVEFKKNNYYEASSLFFRSYEIYSLLGAADSELALAKYYQTKLQTEDSEITIKEIKERISDFNNPEVKEFLNSLIK